MQPLYMDVSHSVAEVKSAVCNTRAVGDLSLALLSSAELV